MTQKFPYIGWVLMPSFAPKQVEFVSHTNYAAFDEQWHLPANGRGYKVSEIYPSRDAAIEAGYKRLAKQQADLGKKQVAINKRRATLDKEQST